MGAAFAAGLTGQDANIAATAGLNAARNNCFDFDHLDRRKIDEEPSDEPTPNPFEPLADASSTAEFSEQGEKAGRFVGEKVSNGHGLQVLQPARIAKF